MVLLARRAQKPHAWSRLKRKRLLVLLSICRVPRSPKLHGSHPLMRVRMDPARGLLLRSVSASLSKKPPAKQHCSKASSARLTIRSSGPLRGERVRSIMRMRPQRPLDSGVRWLVKYVGGTWWELELLNGWCAIEHPECLTLARSENGAFQLSAAVKTAGPVLAHEVEAQSRKDAPRGRKSIPFTAGDFSGFTVGHEDADTHWQKFWLACGNVLVFATYNAPHATWVIEQPDVYAMLATLRPRAPANVLPV
jgi:hypothetical protein